MENTKQLVELFKIPGFTLARIYNKLDVGVLWIKDVYLTSDINKAKEYVEIHLNRDSL